MEIYIVAKAESMSYIVELFISYAPTLIVKVEESFIHNLLEPAVIFRNLPHRIQENNSRDPWVNNHEDTAVVAQTIHQVSSN
jgi:hypothetical protein